MNQQDYRLSSSGSSNISVRSEVIGHQPSASQSFIVVDRQEFIRGCLSSWINTSCPDCNLSSVADVTTALPATTLAQATVVILSANAPMLVDGWLDGQVAWLRANRPDVPIVAIVEPDEVRPVAELVVRLRLQGYIPTASSMEVAAAVLRLVAAGGTYIPYIRDENPPPIPAGRIRRNPEATRAAGLTPRERGVLELLERGMANKIIAYRLSLSQSTVKAHVHNILAKLKVNNRTEAAVAAHLQSANGAEHIVSSMRPALSGR